MPQVNIYISTEDEEMFLNLFREFKRRKMLPKNSRSLVTGKILRDYAEMLQKESFADLRSVVNKNLIFEYADRQQAQSSDEKREREKAQKFDQFTELLMRGDLVVDTTELEEKNANLELKIDRQEQEIALLREELAYRENVMREIHFGNDKNDTVWSRYQRGEFKTKPSQGV